MKLNELALSERTHIEDLPQFFRDLSDRGVSIQQTVLKARAEPNAVKTMRRFTVPEMAEFMGMTRINLHKALEEFPGGFGEHEGKARTYSVAEFDEIRRFFRNKRNRSKRYEVGRPEGGAGKVISVANFKGGAAKTTHAIHLAQYLALRGYRVLAIDMDSQASLTSMFGHTPDQDFFDDFEAKEFQTIYPVVATAVADAMDVVRESHISGLDLIPCNADLHRTEFELPAMQMQNPGMRFYGILDEALRVARQEYDVIVIDCPPALNYVTINAIFASDGLFIPVPPHMIDFASTCRFLAMLADVLEVIGRQDQREKSLDFVRLFVSRFDPGDRNQAMIIKMLAQHFGEVLLPAGMVRTTMLDYAGAWIETLYEIADPPTRKTYKRARESMDELNSAMEQVIRTSWEPATTVAAA